MACIYCNYVVCKTDFCKQADNIVNYYNVPIEDIMYWVYDYNRNIYYNFLESLPEKDRYKFEDVVQSLRIIKDTIADEHLVATIENLEKLTNVVYLEHSLEYFENWLRSRIKMKYNF